MKKYRIFLCFKFLLSVIAVSLAEDLTPALRAQICANTHVETVPGTDTAWSCYDPLPGHPTAREREAFIADITPAALAAEKKHGPPAPALIAMALVESGAGLTRMPICSNNLFGWKWYSARAAAGKPAFALQCQPAWDDNNRYIAFESRAESIDFIAMKLATLDAYKADTERFKRSAQDGIDRRVAIRKWVEGISSPYNYAPSTYVRAILRTINDPISPSDEINPARTLFAVNPAPLVRSAAPPGLEVRVASEIRQRFQNGSRYVVGAETAANPYPNCTIASGAILGNDLVAPYAALANSPNVKLLECIYPSERHDGRQGWALIAAATPENLAARLVGACTRVAPHRVAECVAKLNPPLGSVPDYRLPVFANSFIFPITGFVFEGPDNCKDGSGKDGLIGFRHGVTILYGSSPTSNTALSFCFSTSKPIEWQKTVALTHATARVRVKARLAAIGRGQVPGRSFPVTPVKGLAPDSFQTYVRDNEIRALHTGRDDMMVIKAAEIMGVPVPQ